MRHLVLIAALWAAVGQVQPAIATFAFQGGFSYRTRRDLVPRGRLHLAPKWQWNSPSFWNLSELHTLSELHLEKPIEPYQGWEIPSARLRLFVPIKSIRPWVGIRGIHVDRWALDGNQVRLESGANWNMVLGRYFSLRPELQVWHQMNQFRLTESGNSLSTWGLRQSVELQAQSGRYQAQLAIAASQWLSGSWKNQFGTELEVRVHVSRALSMGIFYNWTFYPVDPVSGRFARVRLFDDEHATLGSFLEWTL